MNGYKMVTFSQIWTLFNLQSCHFAERQSKNKNPDTSEQSMRHTTFQGKTDRAVREQKKDMIYFPSTSAVEQFKLIYKPDAKNMYYTHVYIFIFIYIHIHKMVQFDSHVTKKKK